MLEGDFAVCMESLQGKTREVTDVQAVLNQAAEVEAEYQALKL